MISLNITRQQLLVLLSILTLTGCSSSPMQSEPEQAPNVTKPSARDMSQNKTGGGAPKAGNNGGYYKDDGPGENTPNIDAIPNAIPKAEVPLARANKPYKALGQSYTPMTEYKPYKASGTASWYGRRYHGQKTASGEVYDMYAMTAAHTILPLTSYATVTNPANGKSVIVRINDRGPFLHDRLIDLSYAAAYKLGLVAKGSGFVEVEAIDTSASAMLKMPVTLQASTVLGATQVPAASENSAVNNTQQASLTPKPGIYLQAGAFKSRENADKLSQKITQQNLDLNVTMQTWYNAGTYRVWLGPFASKQDALTAAPTLKPITGNLPITVTQP